MSNASNYFEAAICNLLRGTGVSAITPYCALFDGNPGEDGSGATEVTTDVRAAGRVAITFGAPSNGVMSNSSAIDFGTSDGSATVAGFGIFDASSSGNLIAYGTLSSQSVTAGNAVSFAIGDLEITVA